MTRPYSMDLRTRVVAAVLAGRSCREAAAIFAVSVASVVRWSQRPRPTGSPAPKPIGGRRRWTLLPARDWLLARIAAAPDLTVRALQAELAAHGWQASYGALWAFLAEEGLSFKKKPARRRAGSPRRGAQAAALEGAPA